MFSFFNFSSFEKIKSYYSEKQINVSGGVSSLKSSSTFVVQLYMHVCEYVHALYLQLCVRVYACYVCVCCSGATRGCVWRTALDQKVWTEVGDCGHRGGSAAGLAAVAFLLLSDTVTVPGTDV